MNLCKEKHKMSKLMLTALATAMANGVWADTLIVSGSPSVVRNAEIREAIRQDTMWTSENIQRNPYLFLQDQIRGCDRLKAKIESQNITLVRMEKQAARRVEEAESAETRYSKFLADAKSAWKSSEGKFPISVNGYDLGEDEFNDRIADAMERVDLAKKERRDNAAIVRKVAIRKSVLKAKKRELVSLRMNLSQQAEQVKMNADLAEIGDLKAALGTIRDMMLEIEENPTRMSVEDLAAENPDAKRNGKVRSFLND